MSQQIPKFPLAVLPSGRVINLASIISADPQHGVQRDDPIQLEVKIATATGAIDVLYDVEDSGALAELIGMVAMFSVKRNAAPPLVIANQIPVLKPH